MHPPARFQLFAVGLVSLLGQVVLLRELLVALFGSELILILGMGFLLLGSAAGVLIGRRGHPPAEAWTAALFTLFGLLLPLLAALARALLFLSGTPRGAYPPFPLQILDLCLLLVPFGILGGLLFGRCARVHVASKRTLASAYAIESAGAVAGGAAASLGLALGLQNLAAGLLGGLAAVLAGWLSSKHWPGLRLVPVAAGLLLLAALLISPRLDRFLTGLDHPYLAAVRDTPYGRVAAEESHGQLAVFQNGALAFENQGTQAEEFAQIAALQTDRPASILLLGGGMEGLVREVLAHRPAEVELVELDPRFVRLLTPRLSPEDRRALASPVVKLLFGDPRRTLQRSSVSYDLILSAAPEPESGQVNRFYTEEFFQMVRARLRPGGRFAFRLRSAENLWPPALTARNASILRALRGVFPDTLVLPGTTNLVLASASPLVRDPDLLASRMRVRGIRGRMVCAAYLRYLFTNDRRAQIERELARSTAPPNTDDRPVCYAYTQVLWLSRFFPNLGRVVLPTGAGLLRRIFAPRALMLLALLLAGAAVLRRWDTARKSALVFVAGFIGMVLEADLLLGYQLRSGVLYQDLGLLLTLFMAGLAVGSTVVGRRGRELSRWCGALFLAGTSLLCAAAAALPRFGVGASLGLVGLQLGAAGFLTGGLFAYASVRSVDRQEAVIAPLYAADLLGGCLGSAAGSLLLLPLLGMAETSLLLAVAALLGLQFV
jgi:spermidine synthase